MIKINIHDTSGKEVIKIFLKKHLLDYDYSYFFIDIHCLGWGEAYQHKTRS